MSAFTEANRQAFNDLSTTYNSKPWQHKLANQVATALQSRKEWLGARFIGSSSSTQHPDEHIQEVRLLDYACGTGAITRALGPSVNSIVGIDVAEKMVDAYNAAATAAAAAGPSSSDAQVPAKRMHAIVGDLCGAEIVPDDLRTSAEYFDFDIAVVGLGFHHFEDPSRALARLGERLRASTGVLVIIDFLPFTKHVDRPDGQTVDFPEMQHTIKHSGFTVEQMREMFAGAGFVDFGMAVLEDEPAVMELKTGTVERTLFIAKGRKARA